ncbi:SDR family NAD(P)-dependent oxidoreductase [Neobacillus sp. M.A.Huq-85]|nr:SDR family oxidoreductase [Neobacillus cucumis]
MGTNKGLAVVTGAGSGIGKAIAKRLANDGFVVGVTDIDLNSINQVVSEIKESGGVAKGIYLNVTDKDSITSALDQLVKEFGNLQVWVSNAGVSSMNHFVELSDKDWDFNMNINAKGVFLCGQAAAKRFIFQNAGGKIINTASMAGKQGNVPFLSHYVASKFAVVGLTQAMAHELGKHKITVNAVCPGFVSTPMQQRELEWEGSLKGQSAEEVKQGMIDVTPLRRLEKPEDVAKVVSFLAGPDSDFISGEAIAVNGGAFMD